jgi:undecaprenyl pyrophosphate phosphatase UppP
MRFTNLQRLILVAFIGVAVALICGAVFHNPRLEIMQRYALSALTVIIGGLAWLIIEWVWENLT